MSLLANALITLEDFKVYAGIDAAVSKDDTLFELLINSVSARFDTETGRVLKSAAYTDLYLDGNGERDLDLPNYPITAVASVYEDDILLVVGALYDYLFVAGGPLAVNGILRRVNAVWSLGSQNIKLTFTAGYVTVPSDLQMACLKQCAREWQTQKTSSWGETSRSFGDGSISYETKDLLDDVKAVLNRYARRPI